MSFTRETHLCDSGDDTGEVRSQTTLPSTGNTGNINSNSLPFSSPSLRSTNQSSILDPNPSVQPSTLLPSTSSDPPPTDSQKPSRFANCADSDLFRRLLNYKLDKLRSKPAPSQQHSQSQSSKQSTSFDSYTYTRIGQNEDDFDDDDDVDDNDDNEDDYDDEDDDYYYEKVLFSFQSCYSHTHCLSNSLAFVHPVFPFAQHTLPQTNTPTRTHLSASLDWIDWS